MLIVVIGVLRTRLLICVLLGRGLIALLLIAVRLLITLRIGVLVAGLLIVGLLVAAAVGRGFSGNAYIDNILAEGHYRQEDNPQENQTAGKAF